MRESERTAGKKKQETKRKEIGRKEREKRKIGGKTTEKRKGEKAGQRSEEAATEARTRPGRSLR